LRLFPEKVPNSVALFARLAKEGVYDGTIFNHVRREFLIYGGDPETKSTFTGVKRILGPSPDHRVEREISGLTRHQRGSVSLATSRSAISIRSFSGPQFLIFAEVKDQNHAYSLDGQYTVIGEITDGIDVVDEIADLLANRKGEPLERVEMKVTIVE
jgi:peptidyl-prolyl cis-trans isomerase B (cyclophilin B)